MIAVDRRSLIAKLNNTCRQPLEAAAGLTLSRSHYNHGGFLECFWLGS
jgi:type VI secretion system protein VasG